MSQSKVSSTTPPNAHAEAKPKRQYRTAGQWREIVETYQRSNLTRAEFSKQHSIAISGLYNWQRKFEQESAPPPSNKDAFVEIPPIDTPNQAWDVELELGLGRVLRVRIV